MGTWFRPVDSTENNIGINDSSYYTFRDQKYESLAREIAQNSLDERLNPDKPVKIEFNLFELNRKDFPDLLNYTSLYEDGLKYWKDDSQDNAKKFFQEALNILSKKTIRVMRISDFNTNGVLGAKSDNKNSDSARDL
ncbi:MAG: hypothetical protein GX219_08725, partial [Tissierellia bacterium]|nr:hypothetical protein [Tissierellia bacterium]